MKADKSEDKTNFKINLLTQEIKFAKMLAGNEFNTAIKEKHIKKLSTWLKNRASCSEAFTDKDCLRIWKGLFYSMWMSDKPLPQENLANKIASLLHSFDRVETSLQFYAMFLKTMAMEWAGIDQWRIDKFMMLVRKVTREMLRIVQSNDWDDNIIEQLSKRLSETVLTAGTPRGLFMHLTELYFEEVGKVTNGDIDTETVTKLLKPFMYYIASHSDYKLIQFVVRHVFNYLLFQSEAGREYKEKYDAWKTMGFPGNSINDIVLDEPENDDDEANNVDDEDEQSEGETAEDEEKTTALDPRAGRVDVLMSEIKFDPIEIIKILEEMKYKKFTRVKNRKCIDRVVTTYKKFAGGSFPIGIQKIKVNRDELELPDAEDKAIEFLEFEDELLGKQRELKKMNKRKRKKILSTPSLYEEFQSKSNKIAKLKHDVNTWTEEDITPIDTIDVVKEKQPNLKAVKKTKLPETKQLNGHAEINESKNDVTPIKSPKKAKKQQQQLNGTLETSQSNIIETPKTKKKQKKNEWEQPFEDGEIEYFLPSKKQKLNGVQSTIITKDTPTTNHSIAVKVKSPKSAKTPPKVAILKKSTPKSALSSAEKKVKIVLKMNKSQEATEYIRQLKQSPNLPFDSSTKPLKGVLKPNLMPSPINPFYRKMLGL